MTIETQRRTQRLLIGVIVVLSSLLVAVVLVQLFPPGEPDTLTADQAARYPQTGLPALNPIRMGQANRISPAAAGNSELADFQNTVQPDEDLLRGTADPSQTAPGNTLQPAPASTGDSPVAAGPNAVPNQQPPVSGGEDLLRQLPQMDVNQPDATPPAMTAEPLVSPPQASEPPGRIEVLPQRGNPAAPGGPLTPPRQLPPATPAVPVATPDVDPHAAVFADGPYPSATKCRTCHEQVYEEWASSSHAYASISPMFQKFEQTISALSRGTIGYFCYRCHAPVATAQNYHRYDSIIDYTPVAQEGVTCVACHRVQVHYGKSNGERRIEEGGLTAPVFGSGFGQGLAEVLGNKNKYKVKSPGDKGPGQDIHQQVIHFEQISTSHFCVSCHQVFVAPGIELEVVWEQYRASPACKQGITCQDCHMGIEPGLALGYATGPVAVVNNHPISPERKHSNHLFYGPGYSIAHPGTFPHVHDNPWPRRKWLSFDWRAGWGTEAFEDAVDNGQIPVAFPPEWSNVDDRYDAREIVDANLKKLHKKKAMRRRLMENSSHIEGPVFDCEPKSGKPLIFEYVIHSLNSGHNMPSGSLGAQPQLWFNVALTGPSGEHVWESGYVDANGDIADVHSLEVAAGRVPRDLQLVNLQTKFLITHVKGTDREMALPINIDFDQLPFIRPSAFPVTTMNHPPFIRMEAHSIPPLGSRTAKYKVPARLVQQPGKYRLSARMRFRAEPIYFMRYCNATAEMERSMNEWMLDFHEFATEFWVQ